MELCCQHICFSSLKFWRSSWYFHPGVDAYEYILGSIKVNLPPQLCWTTHSSRKIPTTKYDTKYGKYLQRNMTQNTENTYNKIWHKIRKHGKYLQWNTTHSSRKIPTTKYDTKYGNIKIPTTKYDTKYGKYLQRNMTQNTENTYNKIRHKIRKHGKYQQWNMTQSYFQKTSAPDDTRPF